MSSESVPWARVQAVLARGDRRLASVLASLQTPSIANWESSLRERGLSSQDWTQARSPTEPLPWDFIRPGVGHSARQPKHQSPDGMHSHIPAC